MRFPGVPQVISAAVDRVDYDDSERVLHILYRGGERYLYHDVPLRKYRALLRSESIGAFVNLHIKPCHRYELEGGGRFRPR
jgi:hypothetical protein